MKVPRVLGCLQCLSSQAASFVDIDEDFWNSIQGLPFQSTSKKISTLGWLYRSALFFSSLQNSCRINCFIDNARVPGEGWRHIFCIRSWSIYQRGICEGAIYPAMVTTWVQKRLGRGRQTNEQTKKRTSKRTFDGNWERFFNLRI